MGEGQGDGEVLKLDFEIWNLELGIFGVCLRISLKCGIFKV
jgi:hypothetical protein